MLEKAQNFLSGWLKRECVSKKFRWFAPKFLEYTRVPPARSALVFRRFSMFFGRFYWYSVCSFFFFFPAGCLSRPVHEEKSKLWSDGIVVTEVHDFMCLVQ